MHQQGHSYSSTVTVIQLVATPGQLLHFLITSVSGTGEKKCYSSVEISAKFFNNTFFIADCDLPAMINLPEALVCHVTPQCR